MAFLELDGLTRTFDGAAAVDRLSLGLERGRILALLGPSGSGKTTTLRMLGGFETPDGGRLVVDGEDVTRLSPQRRRFGMVFQHYALFPHLDVRGNIAFGLETLGVKGADLERRIAESLALVELDGLGARRVDQLSGGQQQRVALARALAPEPRVLLLDEPLSNLDPTLRERTRRELRGLIQRVGITTVFVTHDQEEALSIADQIAVMQSGVVEQLATPSELYARPATLFVATFIGTMNLLEGTVADGQVAAGPLRFRLPPDAALAAGAPVVVGVRPEDLAICAPGAAGAGFPLGGAAGAVAQATDLGHYQRISLDAPGLGRLVAFAPKTQEVALGNCTLSPRRALLYAGDRLVGVV